MALEGYLHIQKSDGGRVKEIVFPDNGVVFRWHPEDSGSTGLEGEVNYLMIKDPEYVNSIMQKLKKDDPKKRQFSEIDFDELTRLAKVHEQGREFETMLRLYVSELERGNETIILETGIEDVSILPE